MSKEGIPNPENSKQNQEIIFTGNEKNTDIFNYRFDRKLEEWRVRLEELIKSGGKISEDPEYLELKYRLHIGNAVRFKGGANYGDIHDSIEAQEEKVDQAIFDRAWAWINDYASKVWSKKTGFLGLFNRESAEEALIERIDVSADSQGQLIWAERYKEPSRRVVWHETNLSALKIDPFNGKRIKNEEGLYKLEIFLQSRYGKDKKIQFINSRK